MLSPHLTERLSLIRSKGGKRAAAFWLIRQLIRLDIYELYAIGLEPDVRSESPVVPTDSRFIELIAPADVEDCDPDILAELDANSGRGVSTVVNQGGRVYAAIRGKEVLSQLSIDFGSVHIDSPAEAVLQLGPGDAFLSFLYTNPSARRSGHAVRLISQVCTVLGKGGVRRCICHISTSNVRSLNAFRRAGWSPIAWMFAMKGRRLLAILNKPLASRGELGVRWSLPAGDSR